MTDSKKFVFKKETLDSSITVSPEKIKDFIEINFRLLQALDIATVNFGIWLLGSEHILEFVNPALDRAEKLKRKQQLISIAQKIKSSSKLLILHEDEEKMHKHITMARTKRIEASGGDKTFVKGYLKLAECSDKVLTCMEEVDEALVQEIESLATNVLASMTEARDIVDEVMSMISDGNAADHFTFVTMIALAIGKELKLSDDQLKKLSVGSMFHDIGILHLELPNWNVKALTASEMKIYETHPTVGEEHLVELENKSKVRFPKEAHKIIAEHHEKFEGSGFPLGKRGRLSQKNPDGIHIFSSIVAISDKFVHYLESRQDRPALDRRTAIKTMNQLEKDFDPIVMNVFRKLAGLSYHPF
ncbi:MAG: HD domain-containing protein [Deltaproteobacteria bacterium]|nr:HD domain-containing protein [Deltaproteobacteria bacterium]